jgi:hypothetical protein
MKNLANVNDKQRLNEKFNSWELKLELEWETECFSE